MGARGFVLLAHGDGKGRDTEDCCSPGSFAAWRVSSPLKKGKENHESHVPIRGTRSRLVQRGLGVLRFSIASFGSAVAADRNQNSAISIRDPHPRVEAESAQPAG
jgi:hypothetical protein